MSEPLLGLIKKKKRISLSHNTDRNFGSVKAGNKIYRSGNRSSKTRSRAKFVFKRKLNNNG